MHKLSIRASRIVDYAIYVIGGKFIQEENHPFRATQEDFNKWVDMINCDEVAKAILYRTEVSKQFFDFNIDFKGLIPRNEREEMFYSLKNGFYSPYVPAKCIFYVKKAYDLYRICNLIVKLIPEDVLLPMFCKGYFVNNFYLIDVIRTFCDENYEPVSKSNLINKYEEYSEVYVWKTDMIACIPTKISKRLNYHNVMDLDVDEQGLKLRNIYLKFMEGYIGVCNSTYDLRRLV
ncbi:MAG: hypothetical protein LBS29_04895 [Endomicrobium sp.]|jgi:hypothetical protein|nr:hypothetical protein [Endomicrobium sp.]